MQSNALPTMCGAGIAGASTDNACLYFDAWQQVAALRGQSLALVYTDVRTAFAKMARVIFSITTSIVKAYAHSLFLLGFGEDAIREFFVRASSHSFWFDRTVSPHFVARVAWLMADAWFTLEGISRASSSQLSYGAGESMEDR